MTQESKKLSNSNQTYRLVLSAILIAMAVVLSLITPFAQAFGGSVTLFSLVPVLTIGWVFGNKWGLLSGFVYALLQMLLGANNFGYVSGFGAYLVLIFADYVVPFTIHGLGGLFKGKIKNPVVAFPLAALLLGILRYICHFISGITIWGNWAENTTWAGVIAYSAPYNASYMIPEIIVTMIGCAAVAAFLFPRLDDNGRLLSGKKA